MLKLRWGNYDLVTFEYKATGRDMQVFQIHNCLMPGAEMLEALKSQDTSPPQKK